MYLGNLTIEQLSKRTGWEFSESELKWLNEHRQDNATVRMDSGKFHIFDMPFCIYASPLVSYPRLKHLGL